jgi:hypothetical protein
MTTYVLYLIFNLCLDTDYACQPQYTYIAHYDSLSECQTHIKPNDTALKCLPDSTIKTNSTNQPKDSP